MPEGSGSSAQLLQIATDSNSGGLKGSNNLKRITVWSLATEEFNWRPLNKVTRTFLMRELHNTFLYNLWVKQEASREIWEYLTWIRMKTHYFESCRMYLTQRSGWTVLNNYIIQTSQSYTYFQDLHFLETTNEQNKPSRKMKSINTLNYLSHTFVIQILWSISIKS